MAGADQDYDGAHLCLMARWLPCVTPREGQGVAPDGSAAWIATKAGALGTFHLFNGWTAKSQPSPGTWAAKRTKVAKPLDGSRAEPWPLCVRPEREKGRIPWQRMRRSKRGEGIAWPHSPF